MKLILETGILIVFSSTFTIFDKLIDNMMILLQSENLMNFVFHK